MKSYKTVNFFIANLTNAQRVWNEDYQCYDIVGPIPVRRMEMYHWSTGNIKYQVDAIKNALCAETGENYLVLAFDEYGKCLANKQDIWAIKDTKEYKNYLAEC